MSKQKRAHLRPASRALALEPRLLFDGAAAVAAVDGTDDTAAHWVDGQKQAGQPAAETTPASETPAGSAAVGAGDTVSGTEKDKAGVTAKDASAVLQDANALAQEAIRDFAAKASAADLFALFDGGRASPGADWLAAAEALRQDILAGRFTVAIEASDNAGLKESFAVFIADGPQGKPAILVNADWLARQPGAHAVSRILIEEIGHAIDAALNGDADTAGDEGQRFAARVLNLDAGADNGSDNDHVRLEIDGRSYEAEAATSVFAMSDGSEFLLSFNNPARQTGGADNAAGNVVGTKYLYSNVVTVGGQQIDAIVELTGLSNAEVTSFDHLTQPYSDAKNFQPNLNIKTAGGYATFKITFILGGSYNAGAGTEVTLRNVVVNTYDLDGAGASSSGRQFTDFENIGAYTVASTTQVNVSNLGGGVTRFITTVGGNVTEAPGTLNADNIRARVRYTELSSTTIKVGDTSATGAAYYGLDFSMGPNFTNATTPGVQIVDGGGTLLNGPLTTYESAGAGATSKDFYIKLEAAPAAGETITVTLTGLDTTEGTLSTTTLTFTNANWNTPQKVTVTSINDNQIDGDQTYKLTATTSSSTSSVAYTGRTAVIDVTNIDDDDVLNPVLDLNTNDGGTVNDRVTSQDGARVSLDVAATNTASPTDVANGRLLFDDSDRIRKIELTVSSGVVDGANELLFFGTTSVRADGTGVTAQNNITVGGVAVNVAYGAGVFTIAKADGGVLTKAQTEAIIKNIDYQNTKGTAAAAGDRVFTFKVTDASGKASNTAASTVNVSHLAIDDVTVNEASPYAVFTVTAPAGETLTGLTLANGTATGGGADYGSSGSDGKVNLEVSTNGGTTWTAYTSGNLTVPAGGKVLVRTPITNDATYEGSETFTLNVTTAGGSVTGTATVKDDGTGTKYPGTATGGVPDTSTAGLDDDRGIAVTAGGPFNEASTWATFTVALTGTANDAVALAVQSTGAGAGHATTTGFTIIQYSADNGASWTTYTGAAGGRPVVPAGGSGNILVRVNIASEQDTVDEGAETFALTANYVSNAGKSATGTATIVDDGTGTILIPDGTSNPAPGTPGHVTPDNDRPLAVTSPTVNEASPYAVFTVTTAPGETLTGLTLANGITDPATGGGVDYGSSGSDGKVNLEISTDGGATWTTYTGGNIALPAGGDGKLLVRTPVTNDAIHEGGETFTLTATKAGGSATGTATIADDGTGKIFNPDGTENTAAPKDDDRPIGVVAGGPFNEASTWATFTVSALVGQNLTLTLGNTAVTTDKDASIGGFAPIQYSTDGGTSWTTYTGAPGGIPATTGTAGSTASILVRVNIASEQDVAYEGAETFTLTAAYAANTARSATDTAIIVDDGTGTLLIPGGTSNPAPGSPGHVSPDDDRSIAVTSPVVNEASPHAVFEVTLTPNQNVTLALAQGSATGGGTDFGSTGAANLEVSADGGATWSSYVSGSGTPIAAPADGKLLVRTPIVNDSIPDDGEQFTLTAAFAMGDKSATGTATIKDDGTGDIFNPATGEKTPTNPNAPGYVPRDNEHAPVARPDSGKSIDGRPVNTDVRGNDTDPDGDPLTVTQINGQPIPPSGVVELPEGSVKREPDGSLTFTPKPGSQGTVAIEYTVEDPGGNAAKGRWTVVVVQEAPPQQPEPPAGATDPAAPGNGGDNVTKRPADNLILGSQIKEPSVFFDGSLADGVRRMQIPLHPALYVDVEVSNTQRERAQADTRGFANPHVVAPALAGSSSIGGGLGQDHNLFVVHAIRESQQQSDFLSHSVDGRYGRLDLGSDGYLPGVALFRDNLPDLAKRTKENDAGDPAPTDRAAPPDRAGAAGRTSAALAEAAGETVERGNAGQAPAVRPAAVPGLVRSGGAPSFSEQLRGGAARLPLAPRKV